MTLRCTFSRLSRHGLIVVIFAAVGLGVVGVSSALLLGGAGGPSSTGSASVNLQSGLIGYWPLNGNSKDATPYANNGTVSGATLTTDRKGTANSAYYFAGNNSYIQMTDSTSLDSPSTGITVSAWVNPTDWSGNRRILQHGADGASYRLLYESGLMKASFCGAGSGTLTYATAPTTGVYTLVTATYDGAYMRLYYNGALVTSQSATGLLCNTPDVTQIGNKPGSTTGGDSFYGTIDDVRIYNRGLSSAEVMALYKQYDPALRAAAGENGLLGWWKLNGNTKDSSPYADNGTSTGSVPVVDRKGVTNGAYGFGGSSYISVPAASPLNATTAVTVSAWVKTTVTNSGTIQGIVCKDITGAITNCPYSLQLDPTGVPCFFITITTNANFSKCNTGFALSVNVWHYLVGTYDGNQDLLYIDGVSVGGGTNPGTIATTSGALYIGQQKSGNSRYFNGSIQDVRIYRRALSATEIAAQYASYNSQVQVSNLQSGLVGDWPMNGNAKDYTPYNDNGTVTGATLTSDRKSRASSAYSFNGTSNYISNADASQLDITGAMSISAWVYTATPNTGTVQGIVCKDISGSIGNCPYELTLTNTGVPYFSITNSSNTTGSISFNGYQMSANTWHHLVGTYDGTNMYIYEDGVRSIGGSTLSGPLAVTTGNLNIGLQKLVTNRYFGGSIDDVRIYQRALSQAEVTLLYKEYQ
jgi:hypothetical protein